MLQVPSTPQNQLLDQYDDMIQFHDGKKKKTGRGRGVALCHAFPWFTNNTAQAALYIGKHK